MSNTSTSRANISRACISPIVRFWLSYFSLTPHVDATFLSRQPRFLSTMCVCVSFIYNHVIYKATTSHTQGGCGKKLSYNYIGAPLCVIPYRSTYNYRDYYMGAQLYWLSYNYIGALFLLYRSTGGTPVRRTPKRFGM